MLMVVELVGYFFILLLTINFFMKSSTTRSLMIVYSIVMIASVPISITLLYKINPDLSQYTSEIGKMIGSTFWAIIWMLYFLFSKRVKKTFVKFSNSKDLLPFTIVCAMMIPGYFGYKQYSTMSNLESVSMNKTTSYDNSSLKQVVTPVAKELSEIGILYPLDTFTVHLKKDGSVSRYLKATMSLELNAEELSFELDSKSPVVRDRIIRILSSKTLNEIASKEGKQKLSFEIINTLNSMLIDGNIKYIYFTEFILQ